MTLLTAIFAAVITTVIWYKKAPDNTMRLLCQQALLRVLKLHLMNHRPGFQPG